MRSELRKLVLVHLVCAMVLPAVINAAPSNPGEPACEISRGACSKKSGAHEVMFDIQPKPVKVMEELTFTVTLKGLKDDQIPKISLEMVGMYMGKNEVALVKIGEGRYSGKGIFPRCHSGKKLWAATVEVPGHTPVQTTFHFNVVY